MSVTEVLGGAIGSTLLGLGIASIVTWSLRRPRTDRVLLAFGLCCTLYGARLVADQPSIIQAIGGSARSWSYFRAFVTYAINVPFGLFVECLIGPGWKRSVSWVVKVQVVYAVGAIGTDLMLGRPRAAMGLNSSIVLVTLVVALVNIWLFRARLSSTFRTPAIAAGAIVMVLFMINENLGRPLVPTINLEPLGVFAFVVSLGSGVAATVFRQEAELVAIQRELETARRIQTTLLPRDVPSAVGLDMAVRYVPMTAVAGDLYDFVRLGPSQVGILVADVSGHGVPAALVASMVKLAFAAQAEHANDPASVLQGMNRILCRHVEGTFVTAIYTVIDTERRTITVANAGHPPMLTGRAGGGVEDGGEHGFMLGVFPDAPYVNSLLQLRHGDCVLVCTDGIPETENPQGDFLDLDRVRNWLASSDGHTAAQVADFVLRELRQWHGGPTFEDDVTLVIARFDEQSSATA
jgi:sigma-B regulation protein RsbU (phosphoserine phosphatase)